MGLLAWLAFEGVTSKQTLSHPLIHAAETSQTFWVSMLQVPFAEVPSYPQGVPVCSLTALGQAASPGELVPWGHAHIYHSHQWFGCWLCGSLSRDQASLPGWEEACLLPLTCAGRFDPAESP